MGTPPPGPLEEGSSRLARSKRCGRLQISGQLASNVRDHGPHGREGPWTADANRQRAERSSGELIKDSGAVVGERCQVQRPKIIWCAAVRHGSAHYHALRAFASLQRNSSTNSSRCGGCAQTREMRGAGRAGACSE